MSLDTDSLNHLHMLYRMQTTYVDQQYLAEERRALMYDQNQSEESLTSTEEPFKLNLNALTAVLQTANKVYRQIVDHGMSMLIGSNQLTDNNLK